MVINNNNSHAGLKMVDIHSADDPPKKSGLYLLLCYEWVGCNASNRPPEPCWEKRYWSGEVWQTARYYYDTGGMENFEAVAWCELPPISFGDKGTTVEAD